MSSQHNGKKRIAVKPPVIRSQMSNSSVKTSHHARAPSKGEHTPSSVKATHSAQVKSKAKSTHHTKAPRSKSSASISHRGSHTMMERSLSDSDDVEIPEANIPKGNRGTNASLKTKMNIKPVANLDSARLDSDDKAEDSEGEEDKRDEDEDEGEEDEEDEEGEEGEEEEENEEQVEGSYTEDSDGIGHLGSQKSRVSHVASRLVTPTVGPLIKEAKKEKGQDVVGTHRKHVLTAHVRKIMLDLCAIDKAQDAKQIEPRFDHLQKPMHIVNGVLVPHLKNPFNVEWEAWGEKLVKLAMDTGRMHMNEQEILLSASVKEIREAVRTGVWSTMARTWKRHKDGDGEAWLQGRRDLSRQSGYRIKKSENRMKALQSSGLDVGSFEAVVDPNFQSDEENDPSNENGLIVKVPEYRTEDCTNFLVALDVAYNGSKTRRGNQKYTEYTYRKVNVKVPRLKCGTDIPRWTISRPWETANPDLELESRQYIESGDSGIPQIHEFRAFLHWYAPRKKRTYIDAPSASIPGPDVAAPVDPGPELATPLNVPEPELTVKMVSPPLNHALLPTLAVHQDSNQPSAPLTGSSAKHYAPEAAVVPALLPTPPHLLNHEAIVQPPLGPPPGLPGLTYPPGPPGHFIPVQTPDGQWTWARPSYQWPGSQLPPQLGGTHGAGVPLGEVPAAYMGSAIDPYLQNLPIQHPQPNSMPLPPEIFPPVPEVPEFESVLPAKEKKRKESGNGKEGPRKRKMRKSKEIVRNDSAEDREETLAITGPSQLPSNAGKPTRLHLKVKGV